MEPPNSLNPEINQVDPGKADASAAEVEDLGNCVVEISTRVDKVRLIYSDQNIDLLHLQR